MAQNGTNPGFFQISFQCIWRPAPNTLKSDLKKTRICPIWGQSEHFGAKPPSLMVTHWQRSKVAMSQQRHLVTTKIASHIGHGTIKKPSHLGHFLCSHVDHFNTSLPEHLTVRKKPTIFNPSINNYCLKTFFFCRKYTLFKKKVY